MIFNPETFKQAVKELELETLYNKTDRVCGDGDIDNYLVAETVNDAWEYWYAALTAQAWDSEKVAESRDGAVAAEILNAITVIKNPTRMIVNSKARKMPMRYAVGELLWYLSGSNKLRDIQYFSSAWDRMSDDGETVNSCYGHKIQSFYGFDQWQDVIERLTQDPNSRQAVIHIKNPRAITDPTKDTPCTLSLQFLIRNNRLNLTVTMRSNDVWTGVPYDMFSFCSMQVMMAMRLGVEVGTYVHQAASLHLYERNAPQKPENPIKVKKRSSSKPQEENHEKSTPEVSQGQAGVLQENSAQNN